MDAHIVIPHYMVLDYHSVSLHAAKYVVPSKFFKMFLNLICLRAHLTIGYKKSASNLRSTTNSN